MKNLKLIMPGHLQSRYQKSSIIYMQKLLNTDSERQKKITRSMNAACSREERLQNSSLSL